MSVVDVSVPVASGVVAGELVGREVFLSGFAAPVRVVGVREPSGVVLEGDRVVSVEEAHRGLVPRVGEIVWWGSSRGVWLSRVAGCDGGVRGWVMKLDSVAERRCVGLDALQVSGELLSVEALLDVVSDMHRAREMWLAELEREAHEWADDNDLCERFDDFMEEHGFSRRMRDFEVEVTVRVCGSLSAASEDVVHEAVDWLQISQWIEEGGVVNWDVDLA